MRAVQRSSTEQPALPFPRGLFPAAAPEVKLHGLVLPGQNLRLFICGGVPLAKHCVTLHFSFCSSVEGCCASCAFLGAPCGHGGEEAAHGELGIVPGGQHVTGWNCAG